MTIPGIDTVARTQRMWRAINRIDAGNSTLRGYCPLRMGEHLQFFTQLGIEALLNRVALRILDLRDGAVVDVESEKAFRFRHGWLAVAEPGRQEPRTCYQPT